jgi:hypothetical protein
MMLRPAITEQECRELADLVSAAVHRRTVNSLSELQVEWINGLVILEGTARRFYHVQLAIEATRHVLRAYGLEHIDIQLRLRVLD